MPIQYLKHTDQYSICIWKTTESEAELQQLLQWSKALKIKNDSRRMEFLSSRAAAFSLGIQPATIGHLKNGKPVIHGSNLHISISHTKGFSCAMIGTRPSFGIDIEAVSMRVLKVRERFLNSDEIDQLKSKQYYDDPNTILQYWCAKEAMYKALSIEGLDLREDLHLTFKEKEPNTLKGVYTKTGLTFQIESIPDPEFMLTYCFSEESK